MGGAGKTPFVLWLARRLKEHGLRPAILTRGYRRRTPERRTMLDAGAKAPAALTGDEAQIYLHSGAAAVGIDADRAAVARVMEERLRPGVFLLDDGFQHARLARSLDIVLIDALDPFGGGEPFPLGRLREPCSALARADVIVITRCEAAANPGAIERRIRAHNSKAPVFRCRVLPRAWINARSGAPAAGPPGPFAAFCGLANPAAFWRTLPLPVLRRAFPDHHRYSEADLRRLSRDARAAGAEALVTTEKDFFNLPQNWDGLPIYWIEVDLVVEGESELLDYVLSAAGGTSGPLLL